MNPNEISLTNGCLLNGLQECPAHGSPLQELNEWNVAPKPRARNLTKRELVWLPFFTQASSEMTSVSALLQDAAVRFFHIPEIGTNVLFAKTQRIPPDVELESYKSPAQEGSWNSPCVQSLILSPTKPYWRWSFVNPMLLMSFADLLPRDVVHFVTAWAACLLSRVCLGGQVWPRTSM